MGIKNKLLKNFLFDDVHKCAFTLAEVLITLGIIGVVAAMTIPTLIANTNSAKFRSQYKKAISTLNQAARMSMAQYDCNFATATATYSTQTQRENANPENECSFFSLFNGTLKGARLINGYSSSDGYPNNQIHMSALTESDIFKYQLPDGSLIAFTPGYTNSCHLEPGQTVRELTTGCYGFIDVNGFSLPNKEVTCSGSIATMLVNNENYQDCEVNNDANHMTDIYPIIYHDATVEPATNAAKYVLYTSK